MNARLLAFLAVLAIPARALAQDEPPPLPPPSPPPPGEPAPAPPPPSAPEPAPAPARARPAPVVREAPAAYEYEERPTPAPLGRRGFQLGIRTGASIPAGSVAEGTSMSDVYGWQLPIFFDIGGKPNKYLFIGGYLGLAFGGGSDDNVSCRPSGCFSVSARLGAQIQYHIAPDDRVNPWIGYGIGYQSLALANDTVAGDATTTVHGWEYGRFMVGLDVRISRGFGIGPYFDFSVGEYLRQNVTVRGVESSSSLSSAAHYWITVGPRFVIFP